MKKILTGLALSAAITTAQAAEFSATVDLTNDYRFRGISQSAGDAVLQGSLDVAFDNGIYAGVWGSKVDFEDDADFEVDYYAGYWHEINDDLSFDISYSYYTYPGYDTDADYGEIMLGLYYGDLALTYAHANDFFNTGETGQYIAVDYSIAMNDAVSVDLHAGHSFGDYWNGTTDINEYEDYSVGLSGSVADFDLSVAYLLNSVDSGDKTTTGAYRNDNTVLLTISRTF